ncbi:MAG: glycosyltransferase [Nitrospirales bacterium]|nr:glycosyltransferase [Nitrospirales bacterium]
MSKSGIPAAMVNHHWIHSAYDPQKEAERWAVQQLKNCRPGEVLLIFGVGLLYHVEALKRHLSPDQRVLVVVGNLNELRDCLSVRSLSEWGEEVHWVWGTTSEVVSQITQIAKCVRVLSYDPAASLHRALYEEVRQGLREEMAKHVSGRLHIMVVGPIYGGSLPIAGYVVRALEAMGHRISWVDHSLHAPGYQQIDGIHDVRLRQTVQHKFSETLGIISLAYVAEDPPDLVLGMAQAPLSMAVLDQLRRKKILTAMWFVENFRHLTYWQQMAAGYDFWFVMQKEPCLEAMTRAGAPHVSYLPLAADPTIHKPLVVSGAEKRELGADVSFLGAGYKNRRRLLTGLVGQEWSFKLWGNEWNDPGLLSDVLQRGGARIDSETAVKIFNSTAVNVNLHSYIGEGLDPQGDSVNPRTFELASCGAFQVIDTRTLLPELFDESMMGIFTRPEDLVSTVRKFSQEPELRVSMAEQSRKRVLGLHTYEHRMQTLLSEIGVTYPDRLGSILQGDRQAQSLSESCGDCPELLPILQQFQDHERVELVDLAEAIRKKGPEAILKREELLILMMDEYRQEKRDFL